MWQTETSSSEWSCLQWPWAPGNQLLFLHAGRAPLQCSHSLTTCSIQALSWQESQLCQHVPRSTRQIPQPPKAWEWAPALAGNQQEEAHGRQVWESHELRMRLDRSEGDGGRWYLTKGWILFSLGLSTWNLKLTCFKKVANQGCYPEARAGISLLVR